MDITSFDVTLYQDSEEYVISIIKQGDSFRVYRPDDDDEEWAGCDTLEELNELIRELMNDECLSFVPEDL